MRGDRFWMPLLALAFAVAALAVAAFAGASSNNIAAQEPQPSSSAVNALVKFWVEPITTSTQTWYPSRIEELTGTIVSFDDKQFIARIPGRESEFTVSAQRVIWVEPINVPKNEQAAIDQFNQGEYEACLRPLLDAISARPPVWRQQWLSIVAAQAAMRSGRYKVALELVSQIDRRPLPPMCLGWLPVAWQSRMNDRVMQDAATAKLEDPTAATRLVAASWLLSSPSRSQAVAVLRSLEREANRDSIASLARMLLWQVVPPPEVASQVDTWQAELDSLPMTLQTGPTLTLIGKLNSSSQSEPAKLLEQSLELTPIYPHPDVQVRINPRP